MAGLIQEPEYYEKKVKPFIDNKQISYLGMIPDEQVSTLLGNALCLLHPVMRPERFGLTMAESMACGTPVIGFNKGSVKEVVEHGKTGYIVNKIEEAVESVKKLDKIKREDCRKRVEKYFSVEKMVEGYIQVYEKILNMH
jgi:glycosyltransferase involved in cell wall biosynthesis